MPSKKKQSIPEQEDSNYIEFLKNIELIALALNRCSAEINREIYDGSARDAESSSRNVTAKYRLSDMSDTSFDATASFDLAVRNKADKTALRVECVFEAHFHPAKLLTRSFAERFVESELRLVVWPYFRQFVFDITARMWIPPVLIPFSTRHNPQ